MKNVLIFLMTTMMFIGITQAQNDTMYIMQSGKVVGFYKVSDVDSVIFYKPAILANTVIDIDGNIYNTVTIGTQVWMKENLKVTKYSDGTDIPWVTDATAWSILTTPGYCWYNNDIVTNKNLFGALYNWYALNTTTNGGKNVCPAGWHVPVDAELTYLSDYLGGTSVAGGKLKEVGTTLWDNPNTDADNSSNFTALPSGYRHANGSYQSVGITSNFYSSSEDINSYAIYWYLQNNLPDFFDTFTTKGFGFSVRCIQD